MKNILWLALLLYNNPLSSQNSIEWVIPMGKYYKINSWNDYLIAGGKDGWNILDENARPALASTFESIESLGKWGIAVKEHGKWGFRHLKNLQEWAIQPLYTGDYWGASRDRDRANTWFKIR